MICRPWTLSHNASLSKAPELTVFSGAPSREKKQLLHKKHRGLLYGQCGSEHKDGNRLRMMFPATNVPTLS